MSRLISSRPVLSLLVPSRIISRLVYITLITSSLSSLFPYGPVPSRDISFPLVSSLFLSFRPVPSRLLSSHLASISLITSNLSGLFTYGPVPSRDVSFPLVSPLSPSSRPGPLLSSHLVSISFIVPTPFGSLLLFLVFTCLVMSLFDSSRFVSFRCTSSSLSSSTCASSFLFAFPLFLFCFSSSSNLTPALCLLPRSV